MLLYGLYPPTLDFYTNFQVDYLMLISIYGIPSPLSFVAQRKAIPPNSKGDLDLLVIFRLGSVHFFFASWFPFFPVTN